MDKQKEYLNRVLESIIGETKCDDFRNVISPIMFSINWYILKPYDILNKYNKVKLPAAFKEHCKDVYGLTEEETKTVWYDYKTYIKNNINKLNENVDKQKNFYDKVLDRLLKETVITDSRITFPFANFKQPELTGDSLLSVSQWIDGRWENHKYPHRFEKYVNDIYGITYMESLGLWNSYMEIIEEEVSRRLKRPSSDFYNMDLNESVDKQKEFLDKVVQHMIERFKDDEENKWQSVDMDAFVDFGATNFGLSDLELNYVYRKYKYLKGWNEKDTSSWYLDKQHIYDRRMNESHVGVLPYTEDVEFLKNFTKDLNEKQKGFLDKVVAHLLRETEIDYEKWRINYPFFENTTYSFQYTLPFSGPFIRYCNNIFPLSNEEKKYVHGMYTGIIDSKIRKYYVDNDIYNKYYNVMGTKTIINFDR